MPSTTPSTGSSRGRRATTTFAPGIQYEYVDVFSTAQDNWNGTFVFRTNPTSTPNDARTYPERLQIRVPGASEYTQKEEFFAAFLQDKWRMGKHLTLSLGLRYDLEKLPAAPERQPELRQPDRLCPRHEQHLAARGLRLRRQGRRQDGRARRVRALLRQDAPGAGERRHHQRRVLELVRRELPDQQRGPRTLAGRSPHRSLPGQRADRRPGPARPAVPGGLEDQEHGHGGARQPGPRGPLHRSALARLRAPALAQHVVRGRLRPRLRSRPAHPPATTTPACAPARPAPRPSCASIPTSLPSSTRS